MAFGIISEGIEISMLIALVKRVGKNLDDVLISGIMPI